LAGAPPLPGLVYDERTQRYYAIDPNLGRPAIATATPAESAAPRPAPAVAPAVATAVQVPTPPPDRRRRSCFDQVLTRSVGTDRRKFAASVGDLLVQRFEAATLVGASAADAAIAASADGERLAVAGGSLGVFRLNVYEIGLCGRRAPLKPSQPLPVFGASSSTYMSLCFARQCLLVGSTLGDHIRSGSVFVEHLGSSSNRSCEVRLSRRSVWSCAPLPSFESDGRVLVGCSQGAAIVSLDRSNQRPVFLAGHRSDVFTVSPSADANSFFTGSRDNRIRMVDARTLQLCSRPIVLSNCVSHVFPLANNLQLIGASVDGSIVLFDLRRSSRSIVLRRYDGNRNHFHRLGVCIDDTESFIFAGIIASIRSVVADRRCFQLAPTPSYVLGTCRLVRCF
jgi:WD40 repeat protein